MITGPLRKPLKVKSFRMYRPESDDEVNFFLASGDIIVENVLAIASTFGGFHTHVIVVLYREKSEA